MAKIGYIMAAAHYDKLEEDRQWMQEYGCVKIVEENDADEKSRPLWKQLMIALDRGDELVISKFSNALRGARELAMFLEFCRVKVIRVISIHDRIDSNNELFPETKPSESLRPRRDAWTGKRRLSIFMQPGILLMTSGKPAVSIAEARYSAY